MTDLDKRIAELDAQYLPLAAGSSGKSVGGTGLPGRG